MKQFIALFFSIISIPIFSQSSFERIVDRIEDNLMEVETGNETYTHSLEKRGYSILKYTLIEVDEKGKRKELAYEFNVADLDPYVVREETKQDIIYLSLTVDNGQRFIKKYENGEAKGYVANMLIVTKDIDNARMLKEVIKEAIPMAEDIMTNKLEVSTYEEMATWLTNNISDAQSGSKSYDQKISSLNDFPANFRFVQTSTTSKSSREKQYVFNLADININSLRFNISGPSLSLGFETTRKQKVISVLDNGVPAGFENEIKIFTNNVEEARDLKSILTKVVPLAKEEVQSSIKKFKVADQAIGFLQKYVKTIDYGDESFEQSIKGTCKMKFSRIESGSKSSKRIDAEFNMIDINENLIDYDVTSNKMFVEFSTTESLDLIEVHENNEFEGYEDDLKIYAENVEVARRIKSALESIVSVCKKDYVDPFKSMSLEKKISWLEQNMSEVRLDNETVTQIFQRTDDSDPNKIKLTTLTVDSKNSTEEIYEFNFTDLNPKSIQFDIGSKTLAVSFETNFKEEIIKHYKNGEIENYQDGFELQMKDIEKARNVISVFNQIIDDLNK